MKVEFSAFPKAFSGNVAAFVAADKQLLASAQSINNNVGGTILRAIDASRFNSDLAASAEFRAQLVRTMGKRAVADLLAA